MRIQSKLMMHFLLVFMGTNIFLIILGMFEVINFDLWDKLILLGITTFDLMVLVIVTLNERIHRLEVVTSSMINENGDIKGNIKED